MRTSGWWIAVFAALVGVAGPVSSAPAALPGENGEIAYFSAQFIEGGSLWPGIWTIEPDGSAETRLVEGATSPAWSPDGSKLAYVLVSLDGNSSEVYTANADGSDPQQLTDDGVRSGSTTWSPDGSSIAWSTDRDGSFEIWAMAADGSGKRRVTSLPDDWRVADPSWSPRGDGISYSVRVGEQDEQSVRVVAPDGTDDRQVTPAGFDGWSADWAPDGSRLVFASREEQIGNALYTIHPDGSALQRIPNLQGEHFGGPDGMGISSPAFSPDGTKLLYQFITCVGGRCGEGITLAEADGSSKRTLTAGVRFENFGSPAWQPLNPNRPRTARGSARTRHRCGRRTRSSGQSRSGARRTATATRSASRSPASRTTRVGGGTGGRGHRRIRRSCARSAIRTATAACTGSSSRPKAARPPAAARCW